MLLDARILKEIKELHRKLDAEGKILSRSKLNSCYDIFKRRFGPDKLRELDGELLLNTIHDVSDHDSLAYWLEFKDDDELPAYFGSIAGGSALKFGIYKRKETGAWMTGSSQNQRELSKDEAIQIARTQRDQFLKGAALLEELPLNSSDDRYKVLQESMDKMAPDIRDTAWGHKYFSLLYPNKVDDYHVIDYQRFHLVKLLQSPPEGDGRYICAGRYVRIANELEIPINSLTTITNYWHGRPYRYWRIGTSDGTKPRNRWSLMRDNNCVAIGWAKLGDLSAIIYDSASKDKIRSKLDKEYPNTPQVIGRSSQQVLYFVAGISEGDIVLAADGDTLLGVGKVQGSYFYTPTVDFPHRLPVQWLNLDEWKLPKVEGLQTTVHPMKKDWGNLVEIEKRILMSPKLSGTITPVTVTLDGTPGHIQSVIERKGQVIIYGPPGTGKTYFAEKTACDLAALSKYKMLFDKLTAGQQLDIRSAISFCCFHPAYGYEDFIEGYRPEEKDGKMVFKLRDGIFKRLCSNAAANRNLKYYLIIDEINRGDIPRILGELLTILEKDKRGKSITLPLSQTAFLIPENVYIIGTMNTADRSIALLDTALRRRFGFIELMPDKSTLGNTNISGIPIGLWLEALNQRICNIIGRDARNRQIGHSFFLEGGRPIKDFPRLAQIICDEIIPLLEEYCYEDYPALEKILGKALVDSENQRIRHELFDDARREELVQALLAPCPEILSSQQVVDTETEPLKEEDVMEDESTTA